jgi:hypothetical protein
MYVPYEDVLKLFLLNGSMITLPCSMYRKIALSLNKLVTEGSIFVDIVNIIQLCYSTVMRLKY